MGGKNRKGDARRGGRIHFLSRRRGEDCLLLGGIGQGDDALVLEVWAERFLVLLVKENEGEAPSGERREIYRLPLVLLLLALLLVLLHHFVHLPTLYHLLLVTLLVRTRGPTVCRTTGLICKG